MRTENQYCNGHRIFDCIIREQAAINLRLKESDDVILTACCDFELSLNYTHNVIKTPAWP